MSGQGKLKAILLIAALVLPALDAAEQVSILGIYGLSRPAEARVGRPLTPVSVAGVARRTVRRCAVGVYYC
ncbi:hypothetical protein NKY70_27785 [Sinorhizobium meliloti]|uniref:hypothetical protein n=1 Tax=Sinorhizobium TaxID=28105 RepID=UPI000FD89BE0|nr:MULTISPECIES: hypothetical protein [Sinorhizobium]MDW9590406.1 hypothetical protein [Sinorhizobium meliloti]MDX0253149.1 hypothetical protein [Sinorhizobium meliloti]RVE78846.1 hypothetical protein CN238_33640 [Sinorhizobium meliloti]RVH20778.1 hypothetical protein CN214_31995 [Sinorhizobium meliloti]RVI98246.1 hypothetical protein CN183_31390 [Sinorhizobium medicae]